MFLLDTHPYTMAAGKLLMGLDVGTSTVKGVLVDKENHTIVEELSEPTFARLSKGHAVLELDEQDVSAIVKALETVVSHFSINNLKRVEGIGICGQMHGVVLWRNGSLILQNGHITISNEDCVSPFVTWQDGRCSDSFLSSLPKTKQTTPVSTGYGCATLFWYARQSDEEKRLFNTFDRAGTIMDCFVSLLCGNDEVIMTSQNANSWGYFDQRNNTWEYDILKEEAFPVHLLPRVVSAPAWAGSLISEWCGIPPGVLISVAMGDLQCSVSAAKPSTTDAILNIGTSSQLSIIAPHSLCASSLPHSIVEVPYFNDETLLVAAALTGGNVMAKLVGFLVEFLREVGVPDSTVPTDAIYTLLVKSASEKRSTTLNVCPQIIGERHTPTLRGSVSNICSDNISVGDVSHALMRGIVDNLKDMMPLTLLQQFEVKKFIGCGSTLHKNPVLVQLMVEGFGYPLELRYNVDAPYGAAIASSLITN